MKNKSDPELQPENKPENVQAQLGKVQPELTEPKPDKNIIVPEYVQLANSRDEPE